MEKLKINYDHTYSSKYTRDYYRGKSFHYAGRWEIGKRYVSDEYNTDFVVHDSLLLVCKKNHTASAANEPTEFYETSDELIGLNSPYWDIVMPALSGDSKYIVIGIEQGRGTSRGHAMSQNAVTLELVALEEAIAANREQINADLQLLRTTVTRTAEELRSRAEVIENDIAIKWSEFLQTADEIRTTVTANKSETDATLSDLQTNITQTAEAIRSEASAMREDLEGNIHELSSSITQTASEIRSEVSDLQTDLEGQIDGAKSEWSQTAGAITSRVETIEGDVATKWTEINQTATDITAEVHANKEAADGAIADLDSRVNINAEAIETEVTARQEAIDGAVETLNSTITQTADTIHTAVTQEIADATGPIQTAISEIEQTATGIATRVETLEGDVTTAKSQITQNADAITAEVTARENLADTIGGQITAHEGLIESLQHQVDGAIDMHFYPGVPTLNNIPASQWDTDEVKDTHLGDLYYDKNTGFAYRFVKDSSTGEYSWIQIEDDAIAKALSDAAKAQATADGKMKVFYGTSVPNGPYQAGDLWVQGNKDSKDGAVMVSTRDRSDNLQHSEDWVPASDAVNEKVVKAAIEIMADAITSTVGQYTENSLIPEGIYTQLKQTVNDIDIRVVDGAAREKLEDTGIHIGSGIIDMTADNIILKNNDGERALELVTGDDNKPLIDITNLNVSGIFTTTAWNNAKNGILSDADTAAQGYADTAEENAKGYANSTDYLNNYIVPTITSETQGLQNDIETAQQTAEDASEAAENANNAVSALNYLKEAITEEDTTVAGGLVLSTIIELGSGAKTGNWQVYSGLSGLYERPTSIAFWAGGEMAETGNRAAKAVIRMDGSGYLANKNIYWEEDGDATFTGALNVTSITFADGVTIDGSKISGNVPMPENNVTGSGTTGYIAKWDGEHSLTNGPAFGSGTTKYLREDGTWDVPAGTGSWRPIYCGNESIGNNNLVLKAGSNIQLSNNNGEVTIDTTSNLSAYMLTADYIEAGKIKANLIDVDNLIAKKVDVRTGTDESTRIAYIGDTSWPIYAGGTSANSAVFKVDYAGNMTATSGVIGPMVLSNSGIAYDGSYKTGLGDWGDAVRLFAGASSFSPNAVGTAPFRVYDNGAVYASNFNVSGGNITGTLTLPNGGRLYADWYKSGYNIELNGMWLKVTDGSKYAIVSGGDIAVAGSGAQLAVGGGATMTIGGSNYDIESDGNNFIRVPTTGSNEYAIWGDSAYKIKVVSSLPTNKDSNTLYFVTS